ncbi:MAG: GAF domain-containing protein [Methanospirillaceae archaeon]|nr:GAF domain-containing protein [Methanospirillaceae archaeon]
MFSVLYVDDESMLLEVGKLFLERSGKIHLDILDSSVKALEQIKALPYDAIISDFDMPDMDGIALLRSVRTEFPHLPFIIFTGKGREEIVIDALNNGADHYIQKGGDPRSQFAELMHTVERAIERKQAFDTIMHLSRLNSVLTSTNRAIVHIHNKKELLKEACRIAVEDGQFLMAWIGIINTKTQMVEPVAACGYEDGYLTNLSIRLDIIPQGMGMTGTAICTKKPVVCNDIASDPMMKSHQGEALKRGYRSGAGIPLFSGEKVIGVMRFYSGEVNFFNDEEVGLLRDLVADISFALDVADKSRPNTEMNCFCTNPG